MFPSEKEIYKELDIKTLQLEKVAQYQTRAAILRSKACWYNEGEKNTKVFPTFAETALQLKKPIKQPQFDKKGVINTDDKTLQEAKSFYQNLSSGLKPGTKRFPCEKWFIGYKFGIDNGPESKFGT